MQNAKYVFKINNTVVYPRYKSLKKKLALESGQRFFRTSLEGDITLGGIDYLLVKNANLETLFTFNILKLSTATNSLEPYFEGSFSKTDCKFNNDTRTVKLKIKAKDAYTEILKNYEHEYDLIQLAPGVSSVNLTKRPIVQVYVAGANSISSFIGGTYWEDEVNVVVTDKDELVNKYYFYPTTEINELRMEVAPNNYIGGVFTGQNGSYSSGEYTLSVAKRLTAYLQGEGWYYELKQNGVKLYESAYFKKVYGGVYTTLIPGVDEKVIGADLPFYQNNESGGFAFATAVDSATTSIYQRILTDIRSIDSSATYVLPPDDIYPNSGNYRRVKGLAVSNIFYSDKVVDEPTKYGKNTEGKYFTDKVVPPGERQGKVYPVCRNFWANISFWLDPTTTNYNWIDGAASVEYSMRDGIRISEAIKAMLKKVDSTLMHEASEEYSKFLYSASNPLVDKVIDLYITPKTNILAGDYDQAAQKGKLTFKDLMDMLATCYKCFWFIEGNKFRIEHISWFNQGGSYTPSTQAILDLTTLKDTKTGKPFAFYSNTMDFDKTDLTSRFEFNWMDEVTPTFAGSPINVKSNYIEESKKDSLTATKFSTDIDLMLCKPDEFSKDGFALFSVETTNGVHKIPIVSLPLQEGDDRYIVKAQNGYNSWFFLFNFYMTDLPALQLSADIILANLRVKPSIIKCMKQSVSFPSAEDPQAYNLINTYNGEGQMNDMQIDLDTRQVEVTLYYEPS